MVAQPVDQLAITARAVRQLEPTDLGAALVDQRGGVVVLGGRRSRRSTLASCPRDRLRPGRRATLLCRRSRIGANLLSSQLAGPPASRRSTNRTQAKAAR